MLQRLQALHGKNRLTMHERVDGKDSIAYIWRNSSYPQELRRMLYDESKFNFIGSDGFYTSCCSQGERYA